MAEELQHLIDRLQSDAIAKADQRAEEIVAKAKKKAAAITKEAEDQAANNLAKAEKDAEQYTARSIRTLEQAARDLLITVGQGVEQILTGLVRDAVDEALNIQIVQQLLERMMDAYTGKEGTAQGMNILVRPEEQETLINFFAQRYKKQLDDGLTITSSNRIVKGFKVSLNNGHVEHDFTKEAIAEALTHFLRPHLAEIILRAAEQPVEKDA